MNDVVPGVLKNRPGSSNGAILARITTSFFVEMHFRHQNREFFPLTEDCACIVTLTLLDVAVLLVTLSRVVLQATLRRPESKYNLIYNDSKLAHISISHFSRHLTKTIYIYGT